MRTLCKNEKNKVHPYFGTMTNFSDRGEVTQKGVADVAWGSSTLMRRQTPSLFRPPATEAPRKYPKARSGWMETLRRDGKMAAPEPEAPV